MEETKTKLWNKRLNDLTVRDAVVINIALPAIVVGGAVLAGVVSHVAEKSTSKFRNRKINRQNKVTNES